MESTKYANGIANVIRFHTGMSLNKYRGKNNNTSLLSQLSNIYLSNFEYSIYIIDRSLTSNDLDLNLCMTLPEYTNLINSLESLSDYPNIQNPILESEYKASIIRNVYITYYQFIRNIALNIQITNYTTISFEKYIDDIHKYLLVLGIDIKNNSEFHNQIIQRMHDVYTNTTESIKQKTNELLNIFDNIIYNDLYNIRDQLINNDPLISVLEMTSISNTLRKKLLNVNIESSSPYYIKLHSNSNKCSLTDLSFDDVMSDSFIRQYIILESYYNYITRIVDQNQQLSTNYADICSNILIEIIKAFNTYFNVSNYEIICNDYHFNGTGSYNVAFHHINKEFKNKSWLWGFFDNDDVIKHKEFNNIVNIFKHPDKQYFNVNIKFSSCDIKHTSYEIELCKTNHIPLDAIVYIGKALKDNLCVSVDKSRCNFWSYLLSPVVYNNLSCRLLPMGREDMDMINTLLFEPENDYITIQINKASISYPFKISNRLIRLNTLCNNDEYYAYKYLGASESSSYGNMSNLKNYSFGVVSYMNEHKIYQLIDNIQKGPENIPDARHQTFTLNTTNQYRKCDNYGIKNIDGSNIYEIPETENTLGEMHIATYTVYKSDNTIHKEHMFMNGKTPDSIGFKFYKEFASLRIPEKYIMNLFNISKFQLQKLDDEMLRKIFNMIFNDEKKISIWNNLYKQYNGSDVYNPPLQVFGSNIRTCDINMKYVLPFILLFIFIFVLIICILSDCHINIFTNSNGKHRQNNIIKQ